MCSVCAALSTAAPLPAGGGNADGVVGGDPAAGGAPPGSVEGDAAAGSLGPPAASAASIGLVGSCGARWRGRWLARWEAVSAAPSATDCFGCASTATGTCRLCETT